MASAPAAGDPPHPRQHLIIIPLLTFMLHECMSFLIDKMLIATRDVGLRSHGGDVPYSELIANFHVLQIAPFSYD